MGSGCCRRWCLEDVPLTAHRRPLPAGVGGRACGRFDEAELEFYLDQHGLALRELEVKPFHSLA